MNFFFLTTLNVFIYLWPIIMQELSVSAEPAGRSASSLAQCASLGHFTSAKPLPISAPWAHHVTSPVQFQHLSWLYFHDSRMTSLHSGSGTLVRKKSSVFFLRRRFQCSLWVPGLNGDTWLPFSNNGLRRASVRPCACDVDQYIIAPSWSDKSRWLSAVFFPLSVAVCIWLPLTSWPT